MDAMVSDREDRQIARRCFESKGIDPGADCKEDHDNHNFKRKADDEEHKQGGQPTRQRTSASSGSAGSAPAPDVSMSRSVNEGESRSSEKREAGGNESESKKLSTMCLNPASEEFASCSPQEIIAQCIRMKPIFVIIGSRMSASTSGEICRNQ